MDKLTWSKLEPLNETVISAIVSKPGVYRLSYKSTDGSFYVFYVGKAETSVKDELASIIKKEIDNTCVKTHLENLECYFKYAFVEQADLKDIERSIYEQFKPKCNTGVP